MEKIRLLVIDDNIELTDAIKEYFKDSDKIEVSLTAKDGEEGYNLIKNNQDEYDLILLDLIMPKKDGLYVLEQMKKLGINKKVIVATSYNAADTIREVSEYGVNYFILKPFDISDLEKRIIDINKKKEEKTVDFYTSNIQVSITKILHELGIPSHIKGYQYIREGVGIIFEKPETIGGITKELYPELAQKFDTTVSRVERAIRHAIEISWNRGDIKFMEELFGNIDEKDPTLNVEVSHE